MRFIDAQIARQIERHVRRECAKMGVDGVFAVADIVHPNTIYWRLMRRGSYLDEALDGCKYNLLAIVLAKVAAVIAHKKNCSGEVVWIGEVPYRGALLVRGRFIYAFAGGTEDQDVAIAGSAATYHKSLGD